MGSRVTVERHRGSRGEFDENGNNCLSCLKRELEGLTRHRKTVKFVIKGLEVSLVTLYR